MVFKSKATILSMAGPGSVWVFNTELAGITTFRSRAMSGDGLAMAYKAGAALTMMEKTGTMNLGTGFKHNWYGGAGDASYENVRIVDANGKVLPVHYEGWNEKSEKPETRVMSTGSDSIRGEVLKGIYSLPFYGDFPGMPKIEQKVTWGLMIGEEAITRIIVDTYNSFGFDPSKDMLQNFSLIEGRTLPQWRSIDGGGARGGILTDWNMKTTLDGLYATGDQLPASGDHNLAATTGRYAGRKAADYALQVSQASISNDQLSLEKARVYAPIHLSEGLDWKELHAGIARTMQYFCSEYKTESLFKMGLQELKEIEEKWAPNLFAHDPHKLMRGLEDLSLLTYAQAIIQASLARKASSRYLDFQRIDYPQIDPPEWNKFLTIKLENNQPKIGELPLAYWGNLKTNYESYNKDYQGVWKG